MQAEAGDRLGLPDAKVLSLDPHSLEEIFGTIESVGRLLERPAEAAAITSTLRARVARVREIAQRVPTIRVFALEW